MLVISAHVKNHKQDSIQAIVELTSEDFCSLFSTYYDAMELVLPMSISTDWVDVYGEYTFAKLRTTYDPFVYQQRLSKFTTMFKEPVTVTEFLQRLRRCKVFILGGKLFQILALVVFKELGIIIDNDEYMYYLPSPLTKSAASTKLVLAVTGLEHPVQARHYITERSDDFCIPVLVYKNALCKIQVGYIAGLGKKGLLLYIG